MSAVGFLEGVPLRPVAAVESAAFQPLGLALGKGASAVEVLVATATARPRVPAVRSAWKARSGGRAAPLLLVVLHDGRATLCGPGGDDPPVYEAIEAGQAEYICREALDQPDRHAALRALRDALPSLETKLPGLRNEGFLATHELEVGARRLDVWADAQAKAQRVINQRGETLLAGLGFHVERCDQATSILRTATDGKKVAVAVLLHPSEGPELDATRFAGLSPVSYALAVADRENLPYVLVQQGTRLRLYPVRWAVAVGVECGSLYADDKLDMICELDAVAALLYGLERRHLEHVFATFHDGWHSGAAADHPTLGDFDERLATTLEHFERWQRRV